MKKILLLTRNFPPLIGGMERLNKHIYLELINSFEVSVSAPYGCHAYLENSTHYCELPHSPLIYFLWNSFWKTLRLAIQTKPDLIIAGSGITAFSARVIGYLCKARVITFLHGLDIIAQHPIYQWLFLPAIRLSDAVWVNSSNTKNLAVKQGISTNKIKIIHPGVSIPKDSDFSHEIQNEFRSTFSISIDKTILLSVGRLTERKGLLEFISYSLPDIVKAYPQVLLLIIGDDPINALHHKTGIKRKIQEIIKQTHLEKHIIFLGHVSEQHLQAAYQTSLLHIFPIVECPGDVEGFGMVAIEAAAYGLATIAFAVDGVPDAIAHKVSGLLIEPGNYEKLTRNVINVIACSTGRGAQYEGITQESCKKHAANFSWELFGKKLKTHAFELSTEQKI